MLKGMDISHYQPLVNFAGVKASGISVVFIKATEGKTYQDPLFKAHYEAAKASGLQVGAYHFLRGNAVEDEINNFLSVVDGLNFDCKLAIDAEVDLGGIDTTSRQVRAFADILKSKGMDAVLYTGEYFYNHNLNDSVKDIPLWVAKYSTTSPNVGKPFIGWQYTSSGSVNGVSGRVDLNNFDEEILINKTIEGVLDSMNIKDLQKFLNDLGIINDIDHQPLKVDGLEGAKTKNAKAKAKALLGYILQ